MVLVMQNVASGSHWDEAEARKSQGEAEFLKLSFSSVLLAFPGRTFYVSDFSRGYIMLPLPYVPS
jgi:hypothetical protein